MPGSRVYLEAQGSELRSDVGFSSSFTDYLKVNEKLLIGASARSFYLTAIYLGGRPRHPQLATPHPELVGSVCSSICSCPNSNKGKADTLTPGCAA